MDNNKELKISQILLFSTVLIILILIFASLFFINSATTNVEIKACILYSSENESEALETLYSQLIQSSIASMSVDKINCNSSSKLNLSKYNIIFPDESIKGDINTKLLIAEYVSNGGNIYLTNGFLNYFDKEFLGIKEIVKIKEYPDTLIFPQKGMEYLEIQGLVNDLHTLRRIHNEPPKEENFGFGVIPDTAVSLADTPNNISIYGMNKHHDGTIFYSGDIITDTIDVNAVANQLIRSKFVAYVSKKIHGHVIERVMGPYTRPAAAWQLDYSEIDGIKNNSAILFSEICKNYEQIASFSLRRNSYKQNTSYETIKYTLNDNGSYNTDPYDSIYSAGKHVIENDKYLTITEISNDNLYFNDNSDEFITAYPRVSDFDRDGIPDIVTGSSIGYIYFYKGESANDGEWKTGIYDTLKDSKGSPIKVSESSAPDFIHVDDDGILDLISGCKDGNIYWFKGNDDFSFDNKGILISANNGFTYSMPSVGILYGETYNIIVGSRDGKTALYTKKNNKFEQTSFELDTDSFSAPYIYDINNDGKNDIVMGTKEGYIAKYINNDEFVFTKIGYFEAAEKNSRGNNYLKFGNNSVPCFYDINSDGQDDLIVGLLEYGLPTPIDSQYFSAYEELKAQIDYMNDQSLYFGIHINENEYYSSERQNTELEFHKKAFSKYSDGPPEPSGKGITSHKGYNEKNTGFMYDSIPWFASFRYKDAMNSADINFANALPYARFSSDTLIFDSPPFIGDYHHTSDIAAKYGMPVAFYYNSSSVYKTPSNAENSIKLVRYFLDRNRYNIIREDQLLKSVAASLGNIVKVKKTRNGFSVVPEHNKNSPSSYDKNYLQSLGYKISFSNDINVNQISVTTHVYNYDRENNCIYINAPKIVNVNNIFIAEKNHIVSINLPAKVTSDYINFLEGGFMQVIINGTEVKIKSDGWKAEIIGNTTIISKFGPAEKLELLY